MLNKLTHPINSNPFPRAYMWEVYQFSMLTSEAYSGRSNVDLSEFSAYLDNLEYSYFNSDTFSTKNINLEYSVQDGKFCISSHPYISDKYGYLYKTFSFEDHDAASVVIKITYLQYSSTYPHLKLILSNGIRENDMSEIGGHNFENEHSLTIASNCHLNYINSGKIIKPYKMPVENIIGNTPVWLKLSYENNQISAYCAIEEKNWIEIVTEECNLRGNAEIGIELYPRTHLFWTEYFSNFIQLHLDTLNDSALLGYYKGCEELFFKGVLENTKIAGDIVSSATEDIAEFLINLISKGHYVGIVLNEYYVPDRSAYQHIEYYLHDNFIYGFDRSKKTFYIAGYNKYPTVSEISFNELRQAFNSSADKSIHVFKLSIPYIKDPLNINVIISALSEYLSGINSNLRFEHLCITESVTKYICGSPLYKYILENKNFFDMFLSDNRPSYIIYEHKKIMLDRLEFLYCQNILNKGEYERHIGNFSKVLELSGIIKNLVIKNSAVKNKNNENRIYEMLSNLKELDRCATSELLENLKEKSNVRTK